MGLADCCMPWRQVGCTKEAVGQWRPPFLNVCLALILLVFCVLFYVEAIAIVTENRLKSIINDNFLYF